jgi:L-phenylalanine/L-methionine N-acetyltransferase
MSIVTSSPGEAPLAVDGMAGAPARRAGLEALNLRRVTADDAPALVSMMNDPAVLPGTLQLPYTDAAFWRERLAGQHGGSGTREVHLGAFAGAELVASAGLHPVGLAVRRQHALGLGIAVSRAWQGKGVGDWLMGTLCHLSDHWLAALRIELYVYADNARAVALYEKHGFVVEGCHRGYSLRNGEYVDSLAMARFHPKPPAWPPQ